LLAAKSAASSDAAKQVAEALKRFCRSIELCDDYLRGYYGLKLVGDHNMAKLRSELTTALKDYQTPLVRATKVI
jgi:ER membrane protein complex subunit 2